MGRRPITRDEWTRIKQVAGDAWGQPAADRDAYVRQTCGADEILRLEVTNLLRSMVQAAGAFEGPWSTRARRGPLKGPIRPV